MDSFFIMLCLVALAGIVVCALTGVWVIIQRIISYRKVLSIVNQTIGNLVRQYLKSINQIKAV